jgi:hypothetical protein
MRASPSPGIDAEWLDICLASESSGLTTWDDWVESGHHEGGETVGA